MLDFILKASERLDYYVKKVLVLLISIILLITITQVTLRYVFRESIYWSAELTRYLFIWIAFIGGSSAFKEKAHLSIDIVKDWLGKQSRRLRIIFAAVVQLVIFVSMVTLFVYGLKMTVINAPKLSIAMGISMSYPFACIPIAALIMTIHSLANFIGIWRDNSA